MTAALAGHVEPYENDLTLREHIINRSYDLISRFQGVLFWHITVDDLRAYYGNEEIDNFYSFGFIRNPWDWLVSMYFFIRNHRDHPESMICGHMTFKQFLRFFASKNISQSSFLTANGVVAVSQIFRLEDLKTALREISAITGIASDNFTTENSTDHQAYQTYYDDEDIEFVRSHFAADLALGGYEFGVQPQIEWRCMDDSDAANAPVRKEVQQSRAQSRPRLVLHIGTHKTGTTAIQVRLESLLDESDSIVYIRPNEVFYQLSDAREYSQSLTAKLKDFFQQQLSIKQAETYILSFEGLSGNLFAGYSNSQLIAQTVSTAVSDIFDVKVIIYIRRQDYFIESIYAQLAKTVVIPDMVSFLHSLPANSFDWHLLIGHWRECFGRENINVMIYNKADLFSTGGIFKNFIDAAEINEAEFCDNYPFRLDNVSFNRDAIEIARLVGPELLPNEFPILCNILESYSVDGKHFPLFSRRERSQIIKKFSISNELLRKEYFSDRKRVFDASLDEFLDFDYNGIGMPDLVKALVLSIKQSR